MEQGTPQLQFGSGTNLLGGAGAGDAIAQAMARRGLGGAATDAVSPSAPTFDPTTQPAQPIAPQAAPQAPQAPTGAPQSMNAMGATPSQSDDTLIIKALAKKLENNHDARQAGVA